MKKYSTIIFDFDGTLLYTVQDLADAVNYALDKLAYPCHSVDKIQSFVGNGVPTLVARSVPGGREDPHYEEALQYFKEYYSVHSMDNTAPYDGVMEMLYELKARGHKLAIVTNKYQAAAEVLRVHFFEDTVPLIVGDFEGRERKPAPDAMYVAMEELGSQRSDCVYVGDTEVDRQTAENAGVDFIACSWGYRSRAQLEEMKIPFIVDNPAELIDMV